MTAALRVDVSPRASKLLSAAADYSVQIYDETIESTIKF